MHRIRQSMAFVQIHDIEGLRLLLSQLSLTGITFVASSGDGGVAYSQAEGCLVGGSLEFFVDEGSFVGQFPASCPYVTAVGATSVAPGKTVRLRT